MVRSILTATLAFAALGHAAAQSVSETGDAARGRQLFMADGCYECHGTVGQGGVGLRLAPSPLPAAVIAAYIHNPGGEMPPYTTKVVSNADVSDIHAYLASVPTPPKVADIPALSGGG